VETLFSDDKPSHSAAIGRPSRWLRATRLSNSGSYVFFSGGTMGVVLDHEDGGLRVSSHPTGRKGKKREDSRTARGLGANLPRWRRGK